MPPVKEFYIFPYFHFLLFLTSPPFDLMISIIWHRAVTHRFGALQPTRHIAQYAERERVNLNAGGCVSKADLIKHKQNTAAEYAS